MSQAPGLGGSLVVPGQTLDFYNALEKNAGGPAKVQEFARLFFAPGVMHCGGGPGPGSFNSANAGTRNPASSGPQDDLFAAMAHWVEDGVAPAQGAARAPWHRVICGWPAPGHHVGYRRPATAIVAPPATAVAEWRPWPPGSQASTS